MPRKDFNQVAFDIVQRAIGEAPPLVREKAESASAKHGRKGGKRRATKLSKKRRVDIATKAAKARWKKKEPATRTGSRR
jgi:hypothetical protein